MKAILSAMKFMMPILGTKTEVGGFLDVLKQEKDVEIVPLFVRLRFHRGWYQQKRIHHRKANVAVTSAGGKAGRFINRSAWSNGSRASFDPEEHLLGKIRGLSEAMFPLRQRWICTQI